MAKKAKLARFIACTPMRLPEESWLEAAAEAVRQNPVNKPAERDFALASGFTLEPIHIAVATQRYWKAGGVKLSVGFLDSPAADLRSRILSHMNAWGQTANVKFLESGSAASAQVRIARQRGSGYWSYLGTDILGIPAGQPTMNLEGFTMSTPDSEFFRVVRHETGHTLGCPHEHMRREIVARIDPEKAIAYFMRTQGWKRQMVIQQVLTPLEESSLIATPHADETSVMTYQLPGSITVDGKPVAGGTDINAADAEFMAGIYPLAVQPPPPPPGEGVLSVYPESRQVSLPAGWTVRA